MRERYPMIPLGRILYTVQYYTRSACHFDYLSNGVIMKHRLLPTTPPYVHPKIFTRLGEKEDEESPANRRRNEGERERRGRETERESKKERRRKKKAGESTRETRGRE